MSCIGMDGSVFVCSIFAFILYINTLPADFVYDDSRAILQNGDVLGETPLSSLLYNDFWGTRLTHSGSHRSYRPLTVLTFRANRAVDDWLRGGAGGGAPRPVGFHLVNALLHAATTAAYVALAGGVAGRPTALWAGLLFAAHPVHTEAVAGVVGRADVLAALFFMLAALAYARYCRRRDGRDAAGRRHRWRHLAATAALSVGALLSKEHGVTVLGVCAVYDAFVHSRLTPRQALRLWQKRHKRTREGVLSLVVVATVCLCVRLYVMGGEAPSFAPADNPAADSDSATTRALTFAYLPLLNAWLLVCPSTLSFDWSMDAVPLLRTVWDGRALAAVAFYAALVAAAVRVATQLNAATVTGRRKCSTERNARSVERNVHATLTAVVGDAATQDACRPDRKRSAGGQRNGVQRRAAVVVANGHRRASTSSTDSDRWSASSSPPSPSPSSASPRVVVLAVAMTVLPFLPATNLFFYVGFVIAERVLYVPSAGVCLLVAHGGVALRRRWPATRRAVAAAGVALLVAFAAQTLRRNRDWLSEERLYRAGIGVNPAKAWGNLANVLNSQGRFTEAETAYREALQHRSNMADVHYNLGIMLQEQKRYDEAIHSYEMAIQCRPRLTMAHLNLGIIYTATGKKIEAEKMYRHCAEIDVSGLKDPRLHEQTRISALYNLGRLLADDDRYQNAIEVYEEAIRRKPSHYAAQSLFNMLGEAYFKLEQLTTAEYWYEEALRVKSDHMPAFLTMGKLYQRKGQLDVAEDWFLRAKVLAPTDASVFQHYAQFLGESGRHAEAAEAFQQAALWSPADFELIFNTANALRQANNNEEAETYYKKAVALRPDMATTHMNLGAMLHYNGKLAEAEQSYLAALRLKPDDDVTQTNLRKLRNLMHMRPAR